jgi:hypothetical protein
MLIKIIVQGGVVQDIQTTEPALVQIVDLDTTEISTFATVPQRVEIQPEESEATARISSAQMRTPPPVTLPGIHQEVL